jgi:general secretion pathway protein N
MRHLHRHVAIAGLLLLHTGALAADAGTPPETPSGVALANPLAIWTLDRLSATRERPLFAPTRRPPPPPPPAPVVQQVEAPPVPPPSLVLLGIVTEVDGARAMVRTQGSNKVVRARLGDEIGGWKVTQIEARRLVLSHDDRSFGYTLFERKGAKTATSPPTEPEPVVQNLLAQERMERRNGRR